MRSKLIIIIALAVCVICILQRRRKHGRPDVIVMPDGVRIQKADPRDADEWRRDFEEGMK